MPSRWQGSGSQPDRLPSLGRESWMFAASTVPSINEPRARSGGLPSASPTGSRAIARVEFRSPARFDPLPPRHPRDRSLATNEGTRRAGSRCHSSPGAFEGAQSPRSRSLWNDVADGTRTAGRAYAVNWRSACGPVLGTRSSWYDGYRRKDCIPSDRVALFRNTGSRSSASSPLRVRRCVRAQTLLAVVIRSSARSSNERRPPPQSHV
jgi:hypothetical protein